MIVNKVWEWRAVDEKLVEHVSITIPYDSNSETACGKPTWAEPNESDVEDIWFSDQDRQEAVVPCEACADWINANLDIAEKGRLLGLLQETYTSAVFPSQISNEKGLDFGDGLAAGIQAVYDEIRDSLILAWGLNYDLEVITTLDDAVSNNFSELKIAFAEAMLKNVSTYD